MLSHSSSVLEREETRQKRLAHKTGVVILFFDANITSGLVGLEFVAGVWGRSLRHCHKRRVPVCHSVEQYRALLQRVSLLSVVQQTSRCLCRMACRRNGKSTTRESCFRNNILQSACAVIAHQALNDQEDSERRACRPHKTSML